MTLNKILIGLVLVLLALSGYFGYIYFYKPSHKYDIRLESNVKGVSLRMNDRKGLEDLLTKYNFFEKTDWDQMVGGGVAGTKLKTLIIRYTDEYMYPDKDGTGAKQENSARIKIHNGNTMVIEFQHNTGGEAAAKWAETRILRIVIGYPMLDAKNAQNTFDMYFKMPLFLKLTN